MSLNNWKEESMSLIVILVVGAACVGYYLFMKKGGSAISHHQRLGIDESESYRAFAARHFVHTNTAADGVLAVVSMGGVERVGASFSMHVFDRSVVMEVVGNENLRFVIDQFSIQKREDGGSIKDGVFMNPDGTAVDAWSATKDTIASTISCAVDGQGMEICLPATMVDLLAASVPTHHSSRSS